MDADSSNLQPPFFGPMLPVYPIVHQVVRVLSVGVIVPGYVQQFVGTVRRDREACYVVEPNNSLLDEMVYTNARLVGSHLGLPLYAVSLVCCMGPAPPPAPVSSSSSLPIGVMAPCQDRPCGTTISTTTGTVTNIVPPISTDTTIVLDTISMTFTSTKTLPPTVTITTTNGTVTLSRTNVGPPDGGTFTTTDVGLMTTGSATKITTISTTIGVISTQTPTSSSTTYPGTFGITGPDLPVGVTTGTYVVGQVTNGTTQTTTFTLNTGQQVVVDTNTPFIVGSTGVLTFSPDGKTPIGQMVYTTDTPGSGTFTITLTTGVTSSTTGVTTILPLYGTNNVTGTFSVPSTPGTLTTSGLTTQSSGQTILVPDVFTFGGGGTLDQSGVSTTTGATSTTLSTPTALTGPQNNYPAPAFGVLQVNATGATTFNGFAASPGRTFIVENTQGSVGNVTIANQNAGSLVANRIATSTGGDIVLTPGATATLLYDTSLQRYIDTGINTQAAVTAAVTASSAFALTRYNYTFADFSDPSTEKFITIVPAGKWVLRAVYLGVTDAALGGTLSSYVAKVNNHSDTGDEFFAASELFGAGGTPTVPSPWVHIPNLDDSRTWETNHEIRVYVDSVGDTLDHATAGAFSIWLQIDTLP